MSYDALKVSCGRQPINIVEIDLERCEWSYGDGICTASGAAGSECYLTRATCQDPDSFEPVTLTLRFCENVAGLPKDQQFYPFLKAVSVSPTTIDPGKSLGVRGKISVTLQDAPHHDRGVDPYVATRSYDPMTQGTFFGRLRARWPYYQGRAIRYKSGFLPYSEDNLVTQTYLMEQWEGPDSSGRFRITGKDPLKMADEERAKCPRASTGELSADLTIDGTTFSIVPAGTGNAEYPASGTVRIGREVMTFTRSGDNFTVVRAQRNTEAKTHREGDTVQLCYVVEDARVDDVVYDLLTTYADMPSAFITTADWAGETDTWLRQHQLNACISEPTGVDKLLNELSAQCLFYLWWDDRDAQIRFKPIQPIRGVLTRITDDGHLIAGSVSVSDEPDDRISQVHVYYDQIDPTLKVDSKANYSRVYVRVDANAEASDQYGERRIKEIFSRWLDSNAGGPVTYLGARLLARYRDNPRTIQFSLDVKDDDLWTGDVFELVSRHDQGPDGAARESRLQIVQAGEKAKGRVQYEATDDYFQGRYFYIAPNDAPDFSSATDEQKALYGYISGNDGKMSDGSEGYKIT